MIRQAWFQINIMTNLVQMSQLLRKVFRIKLFELLAYNIDQNCDKQQHKLAMNQNFILFIIKYKAQLLRQLDKTTHSSIKNLISKEFSFFSRFQMNPIFSEQAIKQRTDKKIILNMERGHHICTINKKQYDVFPNVFSPELFPSTQWFINNLLKLMPNVSSFLQIGVGAGPILIEMILNQKCKKAFGTDININAVNNTIHNLQKFNLKEKKIEIIQSDVFSKLKQKQQFEAIFWNYPFHLKSDISFEHMNQIQRSIRDPDYTHLKQYLGESKKFLSQNGKLYLGFSRVLGNEQKLKQIADQTCWDYEILAQSQTVPTLQKPSMCLILFKQKK